MRPIYKFELTVDQTTERCYPIYKDSLAKEFEMEQNQQFFRAKLSGKLTFEGPDYERIVNAAFETQFVLIIYISYNAGQTWSAYWQGTFWKTDCTFDGDAQTVVVSPSVKDQYNDILAGMEKEYNLIDLAPAIRPVKVDKRPMLQIYIPGQTTIGCFLSGMWWEQECEAVSESDTFDDGNTLVPALTDKYHFALNTTLFVAECSGTTSPELPSLFTEKYTGNSRFPVTTIGTHDIVNGDYTLRYYFNAGQGGQTRRWQIVRTADDVVLWENMITGQISAQIPLPYIVELTPVAGSGATGTLSLYVHEIPVYCRYVLDTDTLLGEPTSGIPSDDFVIDNRNYHKIIAAQIGGIHFSSRLSQTPTKWGLYESGEYYDEPALFPSVELYPVSRNAWAYISIWFAPSAIDATIEADGRAPMVIKDAYPLWSVISVLLAKIAPGITHSGELAYSQFLYGTNPITDVYQTLLIAPKSNIVTADYDQPAQKAPITLKKVMDMLRDCFRCYWFIDSDNRFRIEHISYFMNGGQYGGQPIVGVDLTEIKVSRNNKAWAFAQEEIEYDKPNMPARYEFGWMDEVTQLFEGYPIDIISKFVNEGNIEQISVSQFTSDVDYILLNPGEISKDGFVLMSAIAPYSATKVIYADGVPQPLILKAGTQIISIQDVSEIYIYSQIGIGEESGNIEVHLTSADLPYILPFDVQKVLGYNPDSGMMAISFTTDALELPYVSYQIGDANYNLQNGYMAFHFLQEYYAYDLPAYVYSINGEEKLAEGITKMKLQSVNFPALNDPDLMQFVKTSIGDGMIQKLSINLSSRNAKATLKYDTF